MTYLTSFFDDEKLGSYLVRFLPLILSLIYFYKMKSSIYREMTILILVGIIVYLSSERTALFFIICYLFFLFSNLREKIYFLAIIFLVFFFFCLVRTYAK